VTKRTLNYVLRNNRRFLRIAITPGEPAGIGPDLSVGLADALTGIELVLIGDRALLEQRAMILKHSASFLPYVADRGTASASGQLQIEHIDAPCKVVPGRLDPGNAGYVLRTLDRAVAGCLTGEFDAMVTGPVQKSVLNDAGYAFTGHTEYLAEIAGGAVPVMMLVADELRVALATTHLPLHAVPAAITVQKLCYVFEAVARSLREAFGIDSPQIAVCGLNPHAGEGGHLGREEIDVIVPAIHAARQCGLALHGPLPADTAFAPNVRAKYDAYVSMFHDQGLPVLKALGFGHAVNITLGLPFIRTSVDHGTALDVAGTGRADQGSLRTALALAVKLATHQHDRT
jgi:4-hydroxythreonine-4-phosphate dehydrogenase